MQKYFRELVYAPSLPMGTEDARQKQSRAACTPRRWGRFLPLRRVVSSLLVGVAGLYRNVDEVPPLRPRPVVVRDVRIAEQL